MNKYLLKDVLESTTYENMLRDILVKVNSKRMSKAKRAVKRIEIEITYLEYTYNNHRTWLNENRATLNAEGIEILEKDLEKLKHVFESKCAELKTLKKGK